MQTIYVSGATKSVYSVDPSQGNEAKIVISIPEGVPLTILSRQIDSLTNSLFDGSSQDIVSQMILEIRIGA